MTVRPRTKGFQVEVNNAKALKGFKRVRVQCNGTEADAKALEAEIAKALETYRKWPVEEGDKPYVDPAALRRVGSLRLAMNLALATHWDKNTEWGRTVAVCLAAIVRYFEEVLGVYEIDDMTSEDVDAFVEDCRSRGNSKETINKNLSMLSVVNKVALRRKPPLCRTVMPLQRLKKGAIEKWWIRTEQLDDALRWLREVRGDPIFADYIELMVKQGLRPTECLRLKPRDFTGLEGDQPWMKVPGTKTTEAGNSIPVYEWSLGVVNRSIARANERMWSVLFPFTRRQTQDRWNEVREYLGLTDVPTATLRALRRTFAYYSTTLHGMPTTTLKKVLRHKTITTTAGYVDLVGSEEVDQSRNYINRPKASSRVPISLDLSAAIEAYRASGATPEEIAKFTKEMLR